VLSSVQFSAAAGNLTGRGDVAVAIGQLRSRRVLYQLRQHRLPCCCVPPLRLQVLHADNAFIMSIQQVR